MHPILLYVSKNVCKMSRAFRSLTATYRKAVWNRNILLHRCALCWPRRLPALYIFHLSLLCLHLLIWIRWIQPKESWSGVRKDGKELVVLLLNYLKPVRIYQLISTWNKHFFFWKMIFFGPFQALLLLHVYGAVMFSVHRWSYVWYSFYFYLCFGLHQLVREYLISLAAKCSFMFTS